MVTNMSSIAGERDHNQENQGTEAGPEDQRVEGGTVGDPDNRTVAGPGFRGFEPATARVATTHASRDAVTAARVLAAVSTKGLSDDQCLGVLDDIELARRSLDAFNAGVLAEVDARSLCDLRYGSTTASWFERRHGRHRIAIARDAKTGKRIRLDLTELHCAALRGEISFERVAFIASKVNARNLDALAAAQSALLDLSAAEPSWSTFCALVADLARYADADGSHDPEPDTNRASLRRVGDALVVDATFVGADAESFEQLVEAETNRMWRQSRADRDKCPELPVPTRIELRAQALLELVRRGAAADPTAAKPTVTELNLVIDADLVDELDPILAAVLNHGTHVGPGTHCAHEAHVASSDTASDGTTAPDESVSRTASRGNTAPVESAHGSRFVHDARFGGSASNDHNSSDCRRTNGSGTPNRLIPGGLIGAPVTGTNGKTMWFTPSQWELLICNAEVSETLLDRMGMPIAARERLRFPSRAMRRALDARDGGCVFPGCEAPAGWCDAHHVIHYAANGTTTTSNLALLCRRHHGIVHRTGWSMSLNSAKNTSAAAASPTDTATPPAVAAADGFFTITTADGLQLRTEHRRRPGRPQGHPPDKPDKPPGREPEPA